MHPTNHQVLKQLFDIYNCNPSLQHLKEELQQKTSSRPHPDDIEDVVNIYHAAIRIINNEIFANGLDESLINTYQKLFQELEDLIALKGKDTRHKFIIIIPVADRPRHLKSCLQSLLTLCQSFRYGGYSNQLFPKVSVIIADDSKNQTNIEKHQAISNQFNLQGIETIYFGLEEQQKTLAQLTNHERSQLLNIVGNFKSSAFYHKGPSIMRNITYLKLNEMSKEEKNLLFYFVDSDQEFQIQIRTNEEDKELYAINYFYELDRIFSQHNISILTGKVIGDPPVSPAVMAGTFLDDIITFLNSMATTQPDLPCQFHNQEHQKDNDAAYHDMAELFGFKPASTPYPYQCQLAGKHDQSECFTDVSGKLGQFFHGEHPTRNSYFNYEEPVSEIKPARTIYTGNYVFNTEALKYFIPFASLKLRMAGPVLGRIIKSEIKSRFVSANLPMLHKRTVKDIGGSEFRPGIKTEYNKIDLSGEFERQFFGDVMLFTMEKLITMGYPGKSVSKQMIIQKLESTEREIRQHYAAKQTQILNKLNQMKSIFFDNNNWWNTASDMEVARNNFIIFITNIEKNFGTDSICYELIDSVANRNKHFDAILETIIEYPLDRNAWETILDRRAADQRNHPE